MEIIKPICKSFFLGILIIFLCIASWAFADIFAFLTSLLCLIFGLILLIRCFFKKDKLVIVSKIILAVILIQYPVLMLSTTIYQTSIILAEYKIRKNEFDKIIKSNDYQKQGPTPRWIAWHGANGVYYLYCKDITSSREEVNIDGDSGFISRIDKDYCMFYLSEYVL